MNEAGLDFYDRLVDALLANGIQPCVTLYHWDLPQPLSRMPAAGPSRDTAGASASTRRSSPRRLGDRVARWITHNEPWVASWLGYGWGIRAPGRTSDADAVAAAHHLLLSHGLGARGAAPRVPAAEIGDHARPRAHAEPASERRRRRRPRGSTAR